jgi:hypothetical protein
MLWYLLKVVCINGAENLTLHAISSSARLLQTGDRLAFFSGIFRYFVSVGMVFPLSVSLSIRMH